ncbi:carbamoyl-phosphate synthase large subunit [Patescibacteria group bacterium]|nr:carbamoyl-phosphate synthase large subunit [Patescibacteria group bacterium]
MPKRTDLKKIMLIGSGPIVIGQACEFDYSGSQACKALREEGFKTILVNSNPATIQTDPETADVIYIEPLTPEILAKIIKKEKPDALLSTMGGQTALNLAVELTEKGILKKYKVELIGAKFEAIKKAEDRILFKEAMKKIGLKVPLSKEVYSVKEALKKAKEIGYPVVVRPAYTLGGTGGGIAFNWAELERIAERGIKSSRIGQVLIEQSVIGWKEYELEVMRDLKDNVVIICSIENFDPMGIHTGDSITVAPAQTLTDREYQIMRDAAIKVIREIGVETGGSNIQFAVHPKNGEMLVIEMNPRVSRSSALASKATGFPIAKIATKLAIGLTLDEIPNDITKKTPASFEPTIDYVVVKIPRWAFEKFPEADKLLGTQMKSVGEAMAIGRTFEEAFQKAIRSLEIGRFGFETDPKEEEWTLKEIRQILKTPHFKRIFFIKSALEKRMSVQEIADLTKIDPWFLEKMKNIVAMERKIKEFNFKTLPRDLFFEAKCLGFSDRQLADLLKGDEISIRKKRKEMAINPVYKSVDTCGAEFEAETPYFYSTYESEDEVTVSPKPAIMIIGSGPNRIGQGIEFDYCCVHAALSVKEEGYESIMVNSNPETVSTDYEICDKLYFEPLTFEDILNIAEKEKPKGTIVQFGGQTPINLCRDLEKSGVKILGTPTWAIDIAEDRDKFYKFAERFKILIADHGIAHNQKQALRIAKKIGYPIIIRPSYVLGGAKMQIIYQEKDLKEKFAKAFGLWEGKPVLIDKFLDNAKETEIDAIFDGKTLLVGGVMEHIEEAGVHSGDAACVTPPYSLKKIEIEKMLEDTRKIAKALKIIGAFNIQFAVRNGDVYVLEVNPRASRTLPYLSKATGVPLAKIATKVMLGRKLKTLGLKSGILKVSKFAVKEVVLPFDKLEGDVVLGPEMKSTGEVMGIDEKFENAFYKAELAAGNALPLKGNVFISIREALDPRDLAKLFYTAGFKLFATRGTAGRIGFAKIPVKIIPKVSEPEKPNILDYIAKKEIDLIINLSSGGGAKTDGSKIRRAAVDYKITYITTMPAALAAAKSISLQIKNNNLKVCRLLKNNYTK